MMQTSSNPDPEFEALLDYLKRSRGFDFIGYKRPSLMRRVRVQMAVVGIETYADYTSLLEADPDEVKRLLNTILINVTSFFRDSLSWEHLQGQIVPQMLALKHASAPIRIWSAGCATGEEAYSLAMMMAEVLGMEVFSQRVKIHATDMDDDALNTARQAIYPSQKVGSVSEELLAKYFDRVGDRYSLSKVLRRAVIFGRHDLTQDVPISRLDLLVCRNTLMYLNAGMQESVLSRFHFALNDGGFLFLGKAEMLVARSKLFVPVDIKCRIFMKSVTASPRNRSFYFVPSQDDSFFALDPMQFSELAFQVSPLAQLVLSRDGVLVLANEQARHLFRLSPKDIGQPFQNLETSYRPTELRPSIERVYATREAVLLNEVHWVRDNGERTVYRVEIVPLPKQSSQPLGACISFFDVTNYKQLQDELEASNLEITSAYEETQSSTEGLEAVNEELQSSAEELETTNEELQSANEEMETMNEEMQSANEELETTNDELRMLSLELSKASDYMQAILSSLEGSVIVIGEEMQVQAWNPQSEELWGLRAEEVVGKNLSALDFGLAIEQIFPMLRSCLTGASPKEETISEATNRRGKPIRCQVVSTPLKTGKNKIIGAILLITPLD